MNITFDLSLLNWHIGRFGIRIDIDQPAIGTQPVIDRGVKSMSRWWTKRMAS